MRYDKERKTARNEALKAYKEANPDLAWEEIAQVFGISKQRAWAICHPKTKGVKA